MNQKNIFTALALIGLCYSIAAYTMGKQVASNNFQGLNEKGQFALSIAWQLIAAINLVIVLAMYATRNHANVAWAFALGFFIMGIGSLKHLLIDGVDVPIIGIALQFIIVGLCTYLWQKESKSAQS